MALVRPIKDKLDRQHILLQATIHPAKRICTSHSYIHAKNLKHHLYNMQRTFEKCEKILTDWMYNLQTRSFGCIFYYIQI